MQILHKIGVNAAPEQVYNMLSTIDGLKQWWTQYTEGQSEVGGIVSFGFPELVMDMKVISLQPNKQVSWECLAGPEDWVGTIISFELTEEQGQTTLNFSQTGFDENNCPCIAHCSTKWAVYLLGVKSFLEQQKQTAFPNDIQITDAMENIQFRARVAV